MRILLKTLLFTLMVPGTVVVLLPYLLIHSELRSIEAAGGIYPYLSLIFFVPGALIYFKSTGDFAFVGQGTPAPADPPRRLVIKGLYRYTRNPMYIGIILLLLGQLVLYHVPQLLAYCLMVPVAFQLFILYYEEPTLIEKFGAPYLRYKQEVPRWLFPHSKKFYEDPATERQENNSSS